jgi:hypothetical protein
LAASVTDSSGASTISLFTNPPGCAGFFTRTPVLPSRQPPERRTCEYHFFIFVMHFTQQLVVSADSTIESGFPSSERWVSPHSLRNARLSQGDRSNDRSQISIRNIGGHHGRRVCIDSDNLCVRPVPA